MAEVCIKLTKVNPKIQNLENCAKIIMSQVTELGTVKKNINLGSTTKSLQKNIENIRNILDKKQMGMESLAEQLETIIREYQNTENELVGVPLEVKKIADVANGKSETENKRKTDEDAYLENAIQQAMLGEFYDGETNLLGDILSVIVSFVPGLNCVADIRDLAADIMNALNDGKINGKEVAVLALDVVTLVGDVVSLGALVEGIKGATKATKVAKTAKKAAAKTTKKEASKAAKKATKAAQEAAEKGTKKTVRKATKTAKSAATKADEAKVAKKVAREASKTHTKNIAKETAEQVKKETKKNVKDAVSKSADEMANDVMTEEYKKNTREEMKNNKLK